MMWLVAVGTDALVLEFRAPMSAGAHPRFREVPPLLIPLAMIQVHRFRVTRRALGHLPGSQDGIFTDATGFATLIFDPRDVPLHANGAIDSAI